MVEGTPEEARDFVEPWMAIAKPVLRHIPEHIETGCILARCETEVVRLSLGNLMTFPWIKEAVHSGRLELHGFRFDIRTGALQAITA
jgi:carbonic anhydrase